MALNRARVFLGGIVGGIVWFFWSFVSGLVIIGNARYLAAQNAGLFLKQPRYPFFVGQWFIILIVISIILAHLYAWSRQTLGPGPGTALKIGFLVGFAASFPGNFAQAVWSPVDRMFPLGWMLDIWVGCILATLVAGWLYKE
ncbi:MAG TPA: hypothetical protein VEI26_10410 [Terriglobales bacterium]|nr:hypothetical protein [Terriglobales bacterium]